MMRFRADEPRREARIVSVAACVTAALLAGSCGADAGDTESSSPFSHEILTHTFPDGMSQISTGEFGAPAVSYAPVPVGPAYTHVLNFMTTPMMPPLRSGDAGHGPLVIYDDDLNVIVFSPMDHFFVSLLAFEDGEIRYGIEGEVEGLPAGFEHRFLLVRGRGLGATIRHWGDLMLADRGRKRTDRYADTGLSYLGYWTDNGAAYYYLTEGAMNEEDTLLAVKEEADETGIPYGYMQLDSWWYFKEGGQIAPGGLVEWKPQPSMFPQGLASFSERLGLPLITHNRWFARDNAYTDTYAFTEGADMAFPLDGGVFGEFMDDAVSWGVFTYEQDWLLPQFWGVPLLRSDPALAESWMGWMNDAAMGRGLSMQITMAGAAFLMDALDRPAVTSVRTSIDYKAGLSKESFWPQFHTVNMLAWALGILPFKDNFHSSEEWGEAEALISALSAGMVGSGDRIGQARRDLLLATCRDDGLLLKPDRPATPIDAMFLDHARPFTVTTESARDGVGSWTYVAAFHIASGHPDRGVDHRAFAMIEYDARPLDEMFVFPKAVEDWRIDLARDLGIDGRRVAYDWRTGQTSVVEDRLDLPPRPDLYDHDYFVLAPVFDNGLALIGETGKFVTVADKRFSDISWEGDSIAVGLRGAPGEDVSILVFDVRGGAMLPRFDAVIGADGTADVVVSR